jgi:hypothetical protein
MKNGFIVTSNKDSMILTIKEPLSAPKNGISVLTEGLQTLLRQKICLSHLDQLGKTSFNFPSTNELKTTKNPREPLGSPVQTLVQINEEKIFIFDKKPQINLHPGDSRLRKRRRRRLGSSSRRRRVVRRRSCI